MDTTPHEVLTAQLAKWLESLQLGQEKCDFHISCPAQANPETGELRQAFIIEARRQMEKVEDETPPLPPLPDLPPALKAATEAPSGGGDN